jgi:hypothetical protein
MCEMIHNCTAVNDIADIKKSMDDIKDALLGTEYHPGGALEKIRQLENEVERLKNYRDRIKFMALGFGLAGGVSGATIVKYFFL